MSYQLWKFTRIKMYQLFCILPGVYNFHAPYTGMYKRIRLHFCLYAEVAEGDFLTVLYALLLYTALWDSTYTVKQMLVSRDCHTCINILFIHNWTQNKAANNYNHIILQGDCKHYLFIPFLIGRIISLVIKLFWEIWNRSFLYINGITEKSVKYFSVY